jgi:hypothetical protein
MATSPALQPVMFLLSLKARFKGGALRLARQPKRALGLISMT